MAKGTKFPIQDGRYIGSIKTHLSPASHPARKIAYYYPTASQLSQPLQSRDLDTFPTESGGGGEVDHL